jgi:mono/diheme cytochrome c family protein
MMIKTGITGKWSLPVVLPIALAGALTGCAGEASVSFSQDVKPIIDQNCLACHQEGGEGFEASGFSMITYDKLMKGTKFGPMIIGGDSAGSNMIVLMEGRADPSISMPHGAEDPVSKADIETVRLWIDQGAKNN